MHPPTTHPDFLHSCTKIQSAQVVILGHSKGGIDACAALALFPERLTGKVRGIALVQSPYAGNPVCSDILREGQVADFGSRAVLQALMHHALKVRFRSRKG